MPNLTLKAQELLRMVQSGSALTCTRDRDGWGEINRWSIDGKSVSGATVGELIRSGFVDKSGQLREVADA